jgi:hypothetical protein
MSVRDFARPLVKPRPTQSRKRGIVKMAFDELTNERGLTIAMGTREIELTTAINCAVAVIIRLALKNPSIRHLMIP